MTAHRPTSSATVHARGVRRGVSMSVLVSRGQMLVSLARSTGVTDLARLSRNLQQALLASTLSPAERTVLLDAALRVTPPADAVTVAVAMVHALDTAALWRFGRGGLVRLRELCAAAPVEFADVAVRRLDSLMAVLPRFRLHSIDGLTIATRGLGVLALTAVWKSVLEHTERLREHGILREVVMVIRPTREMWTDPAVLECELRLANAHADSAATAALGHAMATKNMLFTDWAVCATPPSPMVSGAVPALVCIARALLAPAPTRAREDDARSSGASWVAAS